MTAAHETRTQDYGREIFARLDRQARRAFTAGWFDERLMGLTMGDEAVKVQLFRFVDSLPLLATRGPSAATCANTSARPDAALPAGCAGA